MTMKAITHLFEESTQKFGNNVFLWEKKGSRYEPTTYNHVKEQVYCFAAGLLSLGIQKGDRIALLSEGRNEWVISELGILYAGGVNVPLSVKLNEPNEIQFRLEHAGVKILITSGQQARKITQLKKELQSIQKIILFESVEERNGKDLPFSELMQLGTEYLNEHKEQFEERWKSVSGADYANISYTSGTEADPKGIILTHRNYTANVEQSLTLMNIPESYITLLILPWDHAFAHTAGIYVSMASGASIASVEVGKTPMETLKNIPVNIKEIKPNYLLSVPSLAMNFKKQIEKGIRAKGAMTSFLFKWGLSIAYVYNGIGWNKGKSYRFFLKPLYLIFDKVLFSKIRLVFGGNLEFFIGGGALLDIKFQRFFLAIGIPMYQGYGLSEASPVISCSSATGQKMGSSGYLVKNLTLDICDDNGNPLPLNIKGEIVVSGENIMKGYLKNPEATAQRLKNDRLYTGDLGSMDKDGFLYVYGRFKSLLIANDGEKYSPEGMEEAFISQSRFIEQCMLYNNQNIYTIVLVVLSKESMKQWLLKHPAHGQDNKQIVETALKMIENEFNEYRIGKKFSYMFPQRWLPAAIGILPVGFTEENHLMNSTMKIVRNKIIEHYHEFIKFLYTPDAKKICNSHNIKNFEIFMS